MDLSESLRFIFQQADSHANPTPQVRALGKRRRVITLAGKESEELLDPPSIHRQAHTLDSVALLTENFGGEDPTAFVSDEEIVVVLNNADRTEMVRMQFLYSEQFVALRQLSDGQKQRKLVRILRTTLAGCIAHDTFLSIIRQIEFDVARNNRATVNHQKETLGNSVDKEVRAKAGDIPETIRVRLPLYSIPHDIPTEIDLECAVTVDIESETVAIEPTGDSLARESKRIQGEIAGTLATHFETIAGGSVVMGSAAIEGP